MQRRCIRKLLLTKVSICATSADVKQYGSYGRLWNKWRPTGLGRFPQKASDIFSNYGDIPFVHWHDYERIRLGTYIEHFGDHKGIATRVRESLLDLLLITKQSIALPLPIYSLKVVEQYVGFKRTQEEYGREWAMAKYIEATELADEEQRAKVVDEILTYNREDLEATWAILQWLKSKAN
jgi:predicted RecB family nuclease